MKKQSIPWTSTKKYKHDIPDVSPYDIPDAVRIDEEHGIIEFRYVDGKEPCNVYKKLSNAIGVNTGKYTGRILFIRYDTSFVKNLDIVRKMVKASLPRTNHINIIADMISMISGA